MSAPSGAPATSQLSHHTALKRRLGPISVALYGLGTTIGAGIYVLLGKVGAEAGSGIVLAFIIAGLVATPSAISFSVLARRFPRSGGEAVYVKEGFNSTSLAVLIGLMVVLAGTVSGATLITGFVGYLGALVDVPTALTVLIVCALLCATAIWGIRESVSLAATLTVIEVCGLLLIIVSAGEPLSQLPERWTEITPDLTPSALMAVTAGSILAFYAFIGFEDIVNLAEEAKQPERTLPLAIAITLAGTMLLYCALAVVAVMVMDIDKLASSSAPLADLFTATTGFGPVAIALIGMIAVINGALVQIIKAARVLYGLGTAGSIPAVFGRVSDRFATPVFATLVVTATLVVLALLVPLENLAKTTSFVTLLIFAAVNGALIATVRRERRISNGSARQLIAPIFGLATSLGLAGFQAVSVIGRSV